MSLLSIETESQMFSQKGGSFSQLAKSTKTEYVNRTVKLLIAVT